MMKEFIAHLILHHMNVPRHVHQKKYCAHHMTDLLVAKDHTFVKPDLKETMIHTALVLPIAPFIANKMSTPVQLEKMKMDANCPINA